MANTIFNGTSRYSQDFQAVMDRAVAMASLPLKQMSNSRNAIDAQTSALKSLDAKVAAIEASLITMEQSVGNSAFSTWVTDLTVLKATTAEGVREGNYSVSVTSVGSYTTAVSKQPASIITDPSKTSLTTDSSFTLTLDDLADGVGTNVTSLAVTPTANTLDALVDAINAKAPSDVQATVVNLGSSFAPDYRLSLQSRKLGKVYVQLTGLTGELMDLQPLEAQLGRKATYTVNGSTAIESDSRTVTLAPGLKLDLLKEGSTSVSVSRNTTGFADALNSFIAAYNGVVDALDKHRGDSSAALSGNSLLATVQHTLKQMVSQAINGAGLSSLAAVGAAFDRNGKLYLDSTVFPGSVQSNFADLKTFLGAPKTGGFLKAATDTVASLRADKTGILNTAISGSESSLRAQDERIAAEQKRLDDLTESLQRRMSEADATIAMLEQQVTYFTGMFEAMKAANEASR